jgi:hypothetical protein
MQSSLPTENPRATFAGCLPSASLPGPQNELDQLREAYRSQNDMTRNLASAQKCLKQACENC